MKQISSRWKKFSILSGMMLVVATAFLGWMHTPGALRLLRAIGVPCPIDRVTTADVVAGHEKGLVALRGDIAAPQRPALGLKLDLTTESEALVWVRDKKLNCETVVRGLRYLRCRDLPAHSLWADGPAISEMWLSFAPSAKLIGLNVYRRGLSPKDLDSAWLQTTTLLREQLGVPTVQAGNASADALMRSNYSTAKVQYRYSNYIATVTAANLAYAGLSLREQYVSGNNSGV